MTRARRGGVWHGAALGAILLLALGLRLFRLERLSLWTDEGYAVWFASQPIADFPRHAARDTCLPLSYLVTKGFLALSRSDWAARLPAVLFGVASVAVTWALGRAVGGRALGLLAAFLLAIHPLHLHYSQEGRMYAMYVCLLGLAALWLMRFISRPNWRRGALLAGVIFALAGTHDMAALWVAAIVAALVPAGLVTRPTGSPPARRVLGGLALVGLAVLLALLPWVAVLRRHLGNVSAADWWIPRPTWEYLLWVSSRFFLPWPAGAIERYPLFGTPEFWRFYLGAAGIWLVLLAMGLLAAVVARRWRLVGVALWGALGVAAIIVVSHFWQSLVGDRVWLPVVIPLVLVEAAAVVVPLERGWLKRPRPGRVLSAGYVTAAAAALGVVVAVSVVGLWSEYTCERKEGWRGAVERVAAECRPGDVIFTREGDPRSDATWCLEQKVTAWYLERHGLTGLLGRVPARYVRVLDLGRGEFEAPAHLGGPTEDQVRAVERELTAGRRVWFLWRIWAPPPPAVDWLNAHAAHPRTWESDFVKVTLYWGLKDAATRP